MIDSEPRTTKILELNATNSTTMEMVFISSWIPYKVTISNYETINKQSEKSNTLQVIVTVENEHLNKHMVAKLDDKVREGKKAWLETNECSNTIALTKASEQKLGTMMHDVNEMRNVCTSSRGVMYIAVMLSLTHPLRM